MKLSLTKLAGNAILMLCLALSQLSAGERDGMATGVFYTSITVNNPYLGASAGNSGNSQTEDSAVMWSLPLHYSYYSGDVYFELVTNWAGWILLNFMGDENENPYNPALKTNPNFNYTDIDLVSLHSAMEVINVGLPLLVGGQFGLGYLGIYAKDKVSMPYFEQGSYVSYGYNLGTNIELGDQFLQTLFLYDWVSMGDDIKGNRWSVEMEYFLFPSTSIWRMVRIKSFVRSTSVNYPKKYSMGNLQYSDLQIGVGMILNIPSPF